MTIKLLNADNKITVLSTKFKKKDLFCRDMIIIVEKNKVIFKRKGFERKSE